MTDTRGLMKLLRIFIATVEGLDEQQIDQLMAGKARLTLSPARRLREISAVPQSDRADILAKLNDTTDRAEARRILSAVVTRDALEAFARTLKVHVVKHDRREDIESKIIEFVIGGKLRSEAFKSLNLKGGGSSRSDDK